ncbi:MAG: translation initiation factor IF-2 [Candidatus Komeilibacteria bacterium]|nr:translation initiation factor IF-2 [Candidatus Komeilibacteria bacterium]
MNVSELARKLRITTAELLEKLPELGFDIGRRAIKIDANLVDKIIVAFEADQRKKRLLNDQAQVTEVKLNSAAATVKPLEKIVKIPEVIIVKDFAEKLNLPVTKIIAELIKNGIMSSLNERIDFTTATIIGEDLGYKVEHLSEEETAEIKAEDTSEKLKAILKRSEGKNAIARPPVVVVMGHVDHGKTKLLDAIRQTNVVAGESGGITQHIGAYQATERNRLITFLDTPGHEAFKSMRSRGSKIADLAIIVVAADDGLKPQTLEVINLAQRENLPFVVAINKIDKPGADVERVKKELAEINLLPEDWGGKTICASISAKEKKGINELLDMVLLVADMEELKADPHIPAIGTIIESHIDKGEGPVATVLIQAGTLHVGDLIIVGEVGGKIKALKDFTGQEVKAAGPSMPVKILGLKSIPIVGDILEVSSDLKKIKELTKKTGYKKEIQAAVTAPVSAEKEDEAASVPALKVVVKSDVLGSQEAIVEALNKYQDPEVKLSLVKKGLGNVTDVDVLDASATGAVILAFRVNSFPSAEDLAHDKGVEVLFFDIIYRLLEEVEARLKKLLKPEIIRTELGKVQVLAIFKTEKKEMIVGGKILEGRIVPGTKAKVLRAGEFITLGNLTEVRSGKQIVAEALKGESSGLKFVGEPVIQENDVLEIYQEEVKDRQLKKL